MILEQAFSLRKQLLINKVQQDTSRRLFSKIYHLERLYYSKRANIVQLSQEYDIPPVAILRGFIRKNIDKRHPELNDKEKNSIVRAIIREDLSVWPIYVSERDHDQLQLAKTLDQISHAADDGMERSESLAWEIALTDFLQRWDIKFVAEEELMSFGVDVLPSTPDVVILDDLYINGRMVRWIDSKCFYGTSASNVFLKKLEKQASRYNLHFNSSGAIIYKLGHSRELSSKLGATTMVLDQGLILDTSTSPNSTLI